MHDDCENSSEEKGSKVVFWTCYRKCMISYLLRQPYHVASGGPSDYLLARSLFACAQNVSSRVEVRIRALQPLHRLPVVILLLAVVGHETFAFSVLKQPILSRLDIGDHPFERYDE
jgi:hypothetical protein